MTNDVQRAIAARVADHLRPGEVVNLGIGIPTLVADLLQPADEVVLETENGLLGVGPAPTPEEIDPMVVNAGKLPVTAVPGASYFSSSQSFGLIRGGHVTTAVLGALQIDGIGRIANWAVPGKPILGVGGAMDLLV
jgi:3-oxoacid CoA-transferase B subunit